MKNYEAQIASNDVDKLMRGELNFDPKIIFNKTLLFDANKINEEIIMG